MPDCMMPFPEDWHDFLRDYSFDDAQEVYTNGSRLIPVFRVEQLIKHLLREQKPVAPVLQSGGNYVCGNCGMYTVGFAHPLTGERVQTWKYCGSCGKKVRWDA